MAILIAIIAALAPIIPPILSWLCSGTKTTNVTTLPGLPGMDVQTKSASKMSLPSLLLAGAVLLCLAGCMGTVERYHVILCEPGAVVQIATDKSIPVRVPDPDDKTGTKFIMTEKNMAGTVAMPKSVYDQLKAEWEKTHPQAGGR